MTDEPVGPPDADEFAQRLSGIDWNTVVVLAIGTFLLGYVLTGALVVLGPSEIETDAATYVVLLGFVFYSAHNVPFEAGGITQDLLANPSTAGQAVSPLFYYAIPIVLLLAAGIILARHATERRFDPLEKLFATVGFSLGYLVVMVLGTYVLTIPGPSGRATLVFERAALFGLLYPLLFTTMGTGIAVIGALLRTQTR